MSDQKTEQKPDHEKRILEALGTAPLIGDEWVWREGESNEWGARCFEIDSADGSVEELATTYSRHNAQFIAACNPSAIRALLADLDEARAALSAAKAGGWQDISTAPKDGTPVILGYHMDEEYGGFVSQGRWHEEDHDGPDNMGHDAGFMDDQFDFFKRGRSFGNPKYMSQGLQPTHWQPLPAPPAQKEPT